MAATLNKAKCRVMSYWITSFQPACQHLHLGSLVIFLLHLLIKMISVRNYLYNCKYRWQGNFLSVSTLKISARLNQCYMFRLTGECFLLSLVSDSDPKVIGGGWMLSLLPSDKKISQMSIFKPAIRYEGFKRRNIYEQKILIN